MAKYFLDTEFFEGTQKRWFGRNTKPTIDLISIGIVGEDGREYYAISKDFNLKEAWNRWQPRTGQGDRNNIEPREYWLRENVLRPIWKELSWKYSDENLTMDEHFTFSYSSLKSLINKYGKTNTQIAEEIIEFVYPLEEWKKLHEQSYIDGKYLIISLGTYATSKQLLEYSVPQLSSPEFYGYYADYDWVAFCWLFGTMMELPKGFPMYCIDLKQELDRIEKEYNSKNSDLTFKVKKLHNYPKQTNEHSAIHDARWNYELYKFLKTL